MRSVSSLTVAFDAEFAMLSTVTALPVRRYMEAAVVAAVPKSVGSCFRYKDAKNADPDLKKNVAKGEALTVAQLSIYTIMAQELYEFLKNTAKNVAVKIAEKTAQQNILKPGLQQLTPKDRAMLTMANGLEHLAKNRAMFLMGLGCLANFTAETVSRLRYKRDLSLEMGKLKSPQSQEKDGPHESLKHSHEDHKRGRHHAVTVANEPSFGVRPGLNPFSAVSAYPRAGNPFSTVLSPVASVPFSV